MESCNCIGESSSERCTREVIGRMDCKECRDGKHPHQFYQHGKFGHVLGEDKICKICGVVTGETENNTFEN